MNKVSDNGVVLLAGTAPHIQATETVRGAMHDVIIALIPVTLVSLYIFRGGAVLVLATCLIGAILGELLAKKLKAQEAQLGNGATLVTGLLLALTLPPTAWWAVVPLYTLGGLLATGLFREFSGGLGFNRFNPALLARLVLLTGRTSLVYMAPFLLILSPFFEPVLLELGAVDALSKATPLMSSSYGLPVPPYTTLLTAHEGGALGETSVLALLIGGAYLLYKKHITWHIPLSILGTVFIVSAITGRDPLFQVMAGGLLLGSFFMATDWVTSPITERGKIIFGICIGLLVLFFRLVVSQFWILDGGVVFAILIMNAFVPAIDSVTRRAKFGAAETKSVFKRESQLPVEEGARQP